MRIVIAAVGAIKDKPLRAAVDEYVGRVRRYVPCDEIEIPSGSPEKERKGFERATHEATAIALMVSGKALTSESFAQGIARASARNKGIVAFLIGGADGLPEPVERSAHERWSLSALTFPHRLARLIVVEQIYRAMTILRGEPYGH